MTDLTYHDPGDEDRTPGPPWCSRCGDAFDDPERPCPNPAPGREYVECGRGGHMFDMKERRPVSGKPINTRRSQCEKHP